MALISTQALTLKSPPTLSLPSHPSSPSFFLKPLNPHSLCFPKSTARFSATPLVVSRAATSSASDFSPSIGEALGEVGIFTAAGESVTFNDLLDQNEVYHCKILQFTFLCSFIKLWLIFIPCNFDSCNPIASNHEFLLKSFSL